VSKKLRMLTVILGIILFVILMTIALSHQAQAIDPLNDPTSTPTPVYVNPSWQVYHVAARGHAEATLALPTPATDVYTYTLMIMADGVLDEGSTGYGGRAWLWQRDETSWYNVIPCADDNIGLDIYGGSFSITRIVEVTKTASPVQLVIGLGTNPETTRTVRLTVLVLGRTDSTGKWESFLPMVLQR
jgi:hypothetical protein